MALVVALGSAATFGRTTSLQHWASSRVPDTRPRRGLGAVTAVAALAIAFRPSLHRRALLLDVLVGRLSVPQ
jgi:hypothetical protein